MILPPYEIIKNGRMHTDREYYPWSIIDRNRDEAFLSHKKESAEVVRDFLNGGDKMKRILDAIIEYGDNDIISIVEKILKEYEK